MRILGLARTAIAACGLFGLNAVALAEAQAGTPAGPTVAVQTPADGRTNCRYKPLAGSHIKVQVCTAKDGAEYRMDRTARTNAVHFFPSLVGPPAVVVVLATALPQVQ